MQGQCPRRAETTEGEVILTKNVNPHTARGIKMFPGFLLGEK